MKKILIYILLLANLGAGLAFALDIHSEGMLGYDSAATDLRVGANHSPHDGDLDKEDHCCHGAAHLVGLVLHQTTPYIEGNNNSFITLSQTPTLLYLSPLLRPPIV